MEGCCESMIKYFMFFINFLFALGKLYKKIHYIIPVPIYELTAYRTGTGTKYAKLIIHFGFFAMPGAVKTFIKTILRIRIIFMPIQIIKFGMMADLDHTEIEKKDPDPNHSVFYKVIFMFVNTGTLIHGLVFINSSRIIAKYRGSEQKMLKQHNSLP